MRANREANEKKEENTYLSRLLRSQNDSVRKLEEKAAEYESKMHKREEEFRKADNDRMRRFFNARFDNIPGAFNENESVMQSSRNRGFKDNQNFKSPISDAKKTSVDRQFNEHEMY